MKSESAQLEISKYPVCNNQTTRKWDNGTSIKHERYFQAQHTPPTALRRGQLQQGQVEVEVGGFERQPQMQILGQRKRY